MNKPIYAITSYLEKMGNSEELRKTLFEQGILSKEYLDDGLLLLYNKYNSPITSVLLRECRSLIIDMKTLKIKVYSGENPLLNKEGMEYMVANSTNKKIITHCYEGTFLSVFNNNNKWYVSTRRCLDSRESKFPLSENKEDTKSYYELFEQVLENTEYKTADNFMKQLDTTKSYYFVLIHHKNKNLIDYTELFGEDYKKLCLTNIYDSEMNEEDIYENQVKFASYDNSGLIFVPEKIDSIDEFANNNKYITYNSKPKTEGLMVKIWNDNDNKYNLIKLQTVNYQFAQIIGPNENIFKGLIYLYQTDKLVDFFDNNSKSQSIRKIVNPINIQQSFDTIGVLDATFKVLTSELFELYKLLWSLKTSEHKNSTLYNILPKEYKDMLFAIRGIYYNKKKMEFTNKTNNNSHLKVSDIYNYLKSISTDTFVALLRMRKLMFNWATLVYDLDLIEFKKISLFCNTIHIKLISIFTNKLYPDMMPSDIPPQKVDVQTVNIK